MCHSIFSKCRRKIAEFHRRLSSKSRGIRTSIRTSIRLQRWFRGLEVATRVASFDHEFLEPGLPISSGSWLMAPMCATWKAYVLPLESLFFAGNIDEHLLTSSMNPCFWNNLGKIHVENLQQGPPQLVESSFFLMGLFHHRLPQILLVYQVRSPQLITWYQLVNSLLEQTQVDNYPWLYHSHLKFPQYTYVLWHIPTITGCSPPL